MIKRIAFFTFLIQISISNAQYSVNGGVSYLKAFGIPKPYIGFHIGGEIPRDNEVSFYLRAAFYANNKLDNVLYPAHYISLENLDPNDFTIATVKADSYFNYKTIDGGMRYYLMDGYDNGFALYGGSNVMGIINKAKYKVGDFDESKYRLPVGTELTGTILNLGVGFSGGAKYTFTGVGSLYFDLTCDYILIPLSSNQTAADIGYNFYSPLLFSFNFGFRKDFY